MAGLFESTKIRVQCDCGEIMVEQHPSYSPPRWIINTCPFRGVQVQNKVMGEWIGLGIDQVAAMIQSRGRLFDKPVESPVWKQHRIWLLTDDDLDGWLDKHYVGVAQEMASSRFADFKDALESGVRPDVAMPDKEGVPIWWKYLKAELISIRDLNRKRDENLSNRERQWSGYPAPGREVDNKMIRGGVKRYRSCRAGFQRIQKDYCGDPRLSGSF